MTDGRLQLLVFDPGCHEMKRFRTSTDTSSLMHLVKNDVSSFKARQYQILSVEGLISDNEDYLASSFF